MIPRENVVVINDEVLLYDADDIPVNPDPSPKNDPDTDPDIDDATRLLRQASDPEYTSFFQFGI